MYWAFLTGLNCNFKRQFIFLYADYADFLISNFFQPSLRMYKVLNVPLDDSEKHWLFFFQTKLGRIFKCIKDSHFNRVDYRHDHSKSHDFVPPSVETHSVSHVTSSAKESDWAFLKQKCPLHPDESLIFYWNIWMPLIHLIYYRFFDFIMSPWIRWASFSRFHLWGCTPLAALLAFTPAFLRRGSQIKKSLRHRTAWLAEMKEWPQTYPWAVATRLPENSHTWSSDPWCFRRFFRSCIPSGDGGMNPTTEKPATLPANAIKGAVRFCMLMLAVGVDSI